MLYLHTSNQLEQLADTFSLVVNTPLSHVFTPEMVVVQNAGMARYLSLQVADSSGISANMEFPFPAEFMWRLLRLVSPDIPEESQCTPDTMRFHIMDELTEHSDRYPELHHYILKHSEDNAVDPNPTWTLSNELAQTLDHYLFYRSDWIQQWEDEPEKFAAENWQARLWLRCVTDKKLAHWLVLQNQFKQNIGNIDTASLPERISFFSMSSLSPGYIDLLGEIGKKTDIHLFIVNPCDDIYWGDLVSEKTHSKMSAEQQTLSDIGNALLASMGKQGRDFIHQLLDLPEINTPPKLLESAELSTQEKTILTQCQHDIFLLQAAKEQTNLVSNDRSITINACHTAMREVEVLHDQILASLEADHTLTPADFVVMMPDVEKYAPYIEAIFSHTHENKEKLPYSIADRNPTAAHAMIEALLKVFSLFDTRFDVESVFELLDYDEIKQQFKLDDNAVNYCRDLAKATNIRWGIDAQSRQEDKLPKTQEHTWKYALDNLLLGYTMGEPQKEVQSLFETKQTYSDLPHLPFTEIEGSDALILSQLKSFTDCIFSLSQWKKKELGLSEWIQKVKLLINRLFVEDSDTLKILVALDKLENSAKLAQFENSLPFSVFQKILQTCLESIAGSESYLGYGITFCSLVPMRSVPFKVVALMGMNDGEFPRQDKPRSFDLMAKKQRRGDRSRRDEDRYLFLESILAARSRLIISYIGQNVRDNTEIPPSILVSELIDSLSIYSNKPTQEWIVKHPLQAHSLRYFENSNTLFSYANQYLKLYQETEGDNSTSKTEQAFISKPLPTLEDEYKQLTLDDLIHFYQNPARAFLKQRMSIQTFEEIVELPIREPFELESFEDQKIRQLILENREDNREDNSESQSLQIARAKGLLPYGEIGDTLFNQQASIITDFTKQLPEIKYQIPQTFNIKLDGFTLSGELNQLTTQGRVEQHVTQPYTREYLAIWIKHLVLNSSAFKNQPIQKISTLYSPESSFQLDSFQHSNGLNADEQLTQLLQYYWKGLHYPLTFFPKSAFSMYKDGGEASPKKACDDWHGNNFVSGEATRFENWLLHRHLSFTTNELPNEFLELSQLLFGQLFSCLNEV